MLNRDQNGCSSWACAVATRVHQMSLWNIWTCFQSLMSGFLTSTQLFRPSHPSFPLEKLLLSLSTAAVSELVISYDLTSPKAEEMSDHDPSLVVHQETSRVR